VFLFKGDHNARNFHPIIARRKTAVGAWILSQTNYGADVDFGFDDRR
jgi:hypothetical protein